MARKKTVSQEAAPVLAPVKSTGSILDMYREGMSINAIAQRSGMPWTTVSSIVRPMKREGIISQQPAGLASGSIYSTLYQMIREISGISAEELAEKTDIGVGIIRRNEGLITETKDGTLLRLTLFYRTIYGDRFSADHLLGLRDFEEDFAEEIKSRSAQRPSG